MKDDARCADSVLVNEIVSVNFILSQTADLTAIIITFFATFFAVRKILNRTIFQVSTKILLLQILCYANLHQLTYGREAVIILYKSFFMRNRPCDILQTEEQCAPYLKLLLTGISGMILGQSGLILERCFATFSKKYSHEKSKVVAITISGVMFVGSAICGKLVLWDDPLQGYVAGCFAFPEHSGDRSDIYFVVCTTLTLFNLLASLVIMRHNKRLEYSNRWQVGARFRKREAIESTETIVFLTLTQFVAMFIYSFGVFFLLNMVDILLTIQQFLHLIVWFYTVPFIAVLFPLLLIYRIRTTRVHRVQTIAEITHAKQTQDDHIRDIKQMWN